MKLFTYFLAQPIFGWVGGGGGEGEDNGQVDTCCKLL